MPPFFSEPTAAEWPALALIFVATAAVILLAMAPITLFRRAEGDTDPEPVPRIFGPFTPLIAGLLPTTERGQAKVQMDLLRAGYFEPVAFVNFQAVRSITTYVPLVAGLVGAVLTEPPLSLAFFLIAVGGGVLGYALPRLFLTLRANSRTEEIRRGLPMLMDTLGLTLSTGASLTGALASSGAAVRRGYPELAREVRLVVAQAKLRSLAHALERWKERQPIPELGSLVFLLAQADRMGTDVTRGLWELSASLQVNARQRAEAAANRVSFYMTFPTVLCLLLAAGLLLAGPGVVKLIQSTRNMQRIVDEARDNERLVKQQILREQKGEPAAAAGPPPGSSPSTP
jgi:tight adherence protein C